MSKKNYQHRYTQNEKNEKHSTVQSARTKQNSSFKIPSFPEFYERNAHSLRDRQSLERNVKHGRISFFERVHSFLFNHRHTIILCTETCCYQQQRMKTNDYLNDKYELQQSIAM